jgi:hypothetical protein
MVMGLFAACDGEYIIVISSLETVAACSVEHNLYLPLANVQPY